METDRWIDRHSITCSVCGVLADEREAIRREDGEGEVCYACVTAHPENVTGDSLWRGTR